MDDTDRGNNTDIAYLDFAKAFDKVPHARLLVKLKALGVNDQVSSWIEAWLTDRRQPVVVRGETSVWSAVLSGVPQGSILGPLLFIVYISDLDEKMTSTLLKFVDDTKISSNSQQELQRDLDTARWNRHKRGRCNSTQASVKSCMWATGSKELQHGQPPTRGSGRGKGPGSADQPNTISQQ